MLRKNFFLLKGALTNKPQAFKFRAWELESIRTRQIFDSFVDEILVEIRGVDIMRILPVNSFFPEYNWITDKTRFFFDALKYQRVLTPFLFLNETLFSVDWLFSLLFTTFCLFKLKQKWLKFIIFKSCSFSLSDLNLNFFGLNTTTSSDFFDLLNFSLLSRSVGGSFFLNDSSPSKIYSNVNNETDFITNLTFDKHLKNCGFVLLVGLDVRYELPKFYLFLKRKLKLKNFKVFLLNVRLRGLHKFNFINLGFKLSTLLAILEGRHWVNNILVKNYSLLNFSNLLFFGNYSLFILKKKQMFVSLQIFCKKFNIKVFNLYSQIDGLNLAFCNFRPHGCFFKNYGLSFFIKNKKGILFNETSNKNIQNCFFLNKNFIQIMLSSFLVENRDLKFKLILPMLTLFERDFLTVNLLGEVVFLKSFAKGLISETGFVEQKSGFNFFFILFCLINIKKSTNLISILNSVFTSGCKFKEVVGFEHESLNFRTFNNKLSDVIFDCFSPSFYKMDEFSKNSLILNLVDNFYNEKISNYN